MTPIRELAAAGGDLDQQQLTDGLGAALGTAAYTSPEHALGKQVDVRTDVFSFGILLYEMCTGRSPFPGDTTGELLIVIVQQVQITPAQLNPDVPDGLARIIDRCLEKDRELRNQHASEIRADLEGVQRDPAAVVDRSSPFPQEKPPSKTSSGPRTWDHAVPREPASRRLWLVPLLGLLAIATAIRAYYRASTPLVPEVSNYTQLTHDGEAKILAGTDESRLYLGTEYQTAPGIAQMPVTGGDPVRLPAPAEYTLPVGISPDGTKLFAIERRGLELLDPGSLWRLPTLNGHRAGIGSVLVTDAAWSPDGAMLAYCNRGDLFLSDGDGSGARKLASLGGFITTPQFSPDGRRIRFTWQDLAAANRSLHVWSQGQGRPSRAQRR